MRRDGFVTVIATAILGIIALFVAIMYIPINNAEMDLRKAIEDLSRQTTLNASFERVEAALARDISRSDPLEYEDYGLRYTLSEVSRTETQVEISGTAPTNMPIAFPFFVNNVTSINVSAIYTPVPKKIPSYEIILYNPKNEIVFQQTFASTSTITIPSAYTSAVDPWDSGVYGEYVLSVMPRNCVLSLSITYTRVGERTVRATIDGSTMSRLFKVTNNDDNWNTVASEGR